MASFYRLRPHWRPRWVPDVWVPARLDTLTGPTSTHADPPTHLYWQPGALDFTTDRDTRLFYASALPALSTAQDARWLDHAALARLWPHLALPQYLRCAWETIHPQLRQDGHVNDRLRVQDLILTVIADYGFALAGGSALIDYDIVTRDTDDIDAFNNRWSAEIFTAAANTILTTCQRQGWHAAIALDQDFRKQITISTSGGTPVVVDIVYYERSQQPEPRATGGLRLVFADVAAGKAVAVAEVARGRDFHDLASIVSTAGWDLDRIEQAMIDIKYGDKIDALHTHLNRFRGGDFDQDIIDAGFDPQWCHRILD